MLTPVDIETVDFKKVALGYSQDEVDEFLDKVIVEFEVLYKENVKLNDKVGVLEDALSYYKDMEETLKNSIVMAEKTAMETKNNANQSAEQIIKGAELKAAEILQDANKKLYDLEYKVGMKNRYDTFKAKLKLLLNTEIEILENSDKEIEFDLHDEAVPSDDDYKEKVWYFMYNFIFQTYLKTDE